MFKGKNIVTKISNGLLLFIFFVMLFSSISSVYTLINGSTYYLEGYTKDDYLYNTIVSIIYVVLTGVTILLLNKKFNLYSDEYPVSRQVFNLFFVLTMLGASISFFMVFCEYFIYKDFSFYTLLTVIIEAGVFILTYIYMLKEKLINKTNSKKTNVINLVIVILLLEYIVGIVDLLLGLIFKVNEMADIVNNLIIYAVGTCIVLIAYKLFNNTKTKISNKVEPTIKEEVKKISKPKKKVKVVSTEKKSTIPKKKVSTSKTKKTTSKKETK